MLIAIFRVIICFVLVIKVLALLSSKVLAPRCRVRLIRLRRLVLRVIVRC
jgi:hypothetical protein